MIDKAYILQLSSKLYDLTDKVMTFRIGLDAAKNEYVNLRNQALRLEKLNITCPDLIKTCITPHQIFYKGKEITSGMGQGEGVYEKRRKFLKESITIYYDNIISQIPDLSFEEYISLKGVIIEEKCGEGGYGEVFKGYHIATGAARAIKRLNPLQWPDEPNTSNEKHIQRFLREFRILESLAFPTIIKVFDIGIAESKPFIIMEWCGGETISNRLKWNSRFTENDALSICYKILTATEYAHSLSVIHRDLTTKNIMINNDLSIKILDYGLGYIKGNKEYERITTGAIGTGSYIPPQVRDNPQLIDTRIDLYQIGVLLHEMLTNGSPKTILRDFLKQCGISIRTTEFVYQLMTTFEGGFQTCTDALNELKKIQCFVDNKQLQNCK